jgi:hypothetical protein
MWTWQFELNDILTTLSIVAVVAGLGYKVLVIPLLEKLDLQRLQDNLMIQEKMGSLIETLKDLKEEIKLSREQRTKAYTEHVKLTSRVDGIENRVDELRGDFHEHTAKAH